MRSATLLHIENDSNDVMLFDRACRKAGMNLNLKVVSDGADAIEYLKAFEQPEACKDNPFPNLVVLDLSLPRVNGFDFLAWMRNEKHLRRLPVLVLTSSKQPEDVKRAYDLGANSYLVKPLEMDALVALAREIDQYWLSLNKGPTACAPS